MKHRKLQLTISRKAPFPLRAEHPAVFSIRTCVNMQEIDKTPEITCTGCLIRCLRHGLPLSSELVITSFRPFTTLLLCHPDNRILGVGWVGDSLQRRIQWIL
jgi:hypothetical protein